MIRSTNPFMNTKKNILLALSALGLIALSQSVSAQNSALPGNATGTKAPNFTLKDQSGKEHSLNSLVEKGKVALVFYRSADW